MPKRTRLFSTATAVFFLAAATAPVLAGQQMDEGSRKIMDQLRATRGDLQKGEEQFHKKQYDKAGQTLLKVLQQMPENAEASYYLAETCYQKGEFEKGLEAIADAEKNYPFIGRMLGRRRMSSQVSPEQQKLMDEIQQLRGQMGGRQSEVQRQTVQTEIASKMAALRALRQKEAGQQKVEETISLPAEYSYTHGNLLFRLKRYEEALAEYEKAIQTDPRQGGAYNNAASIYFMAKHYDKALDYLEKAEAAGVKVNPNFKKAVLQALGK
jgi:tetratricopeptide (TPR) repeat protein